MSIQLSKYPPVDIPDVSIAELLLAKCRENPQNVALIQAETGQKMTYAALAENVRRLASYLYTAGVKKGDVVMVVSPNHVYYPVVILAVAYVGAISTVMNHHYTAGELQELISDTEPSLCFTLSSVLPTVSNALRGYNNNVTIYTLDDAPGLDSIDRILSQGDPHFVSPVRINPREDLFILPFSSGTTGRSKGVMLTHYSVLANILQNSCSSLTLGSSTHQTYVCFLPLYHIYGMAVQTLFGLYKGHTMVMMAKYELRAYLECVQKYKPTILHVVPPVALELAKNPLSRQYDLSSAQTYYCGAAPLGPEVEKEVVKLTGVPHFRQAYGLTETSPNTHTAPLQGYVYGSIGHLLPSTECKIVDVTTGAVLGPGEDGELMIRGPQVMRGYWRRPDATAATIEKDGFLHTGDIGHYDKDGNYFVIDRLKEVIKWKGLQVPPAELDTLILKHPAVADVAVVGIPDDVAGEVPKAFVVTKEGHRGRLTEREIVKFVEDNAAPHKRLRGGVEFVMSIPKSPSGKILRRLLRNRIKQSKL